jgi:hypothetical protein
VPFAGETADKLGKDAGLAAHPQLNEKMNRGVAFSGHIISIFGIQLVGLGY